MQFQLTNEQKEQMKNEVLGQYFNFEFEKKKLKAYLGESLYNKFKENNVIIAGGMIGSLFSNKEINDVDVYFRTNEDLYSFALDTIEDVTVVSHTKKATQYLDYSNVEKGIQILVQLIHFRKYDKPEDIFDTYDFTVCMGAFDFKTESFVLHPDFMKHNSQRILKFNQGTSYPLISAIRVDKYKNKGYTISKAEYFRIVLSSMTLNITSYDELKEHLGGMYGESYDRLIEGLEGEEFELTKAIEMIGEISLHDSYFEEYVDKNYDNKAILNDLDKLEKKFIKLKNNNNYRVLTDEINMVYNLPENPTYLDVNEFFEGKKFYKFVKADVNNAKLYSFYDKSFEYKIGEIVEAKEKYNGYGSSGKLFFNELKHLRQSTYSNEKGGVVIEVEVVGEDVISYNKSELTASKCKVLRVVPEEEWIEYVNPKNKKNEAYDLAELF